MLPDAEGLLVKMGSIILVSLTLAGGRALLPKNASGWPILAVCLKQGWGRFSLASSLSPP